MKKFLAIVLFMAALLLVISAAATAINLVLISMRPETISVVNTIIGQGILIILLLALAIISFNKGRRNLVPRSTLAAPEE